MGGVHVKEQADRRREKLRELRPRQAEVGKKEKKKMTRGGEIPANLGTQAEQEEEGEEGEEGEGSHRQQK